MSQATTEGYSPPPLPETGGGTGPEPLLVVGLMAVVVGAAVWRRVA